MASIRIESGHAMRRPVERLDITEQDWEALRNRVQRLVKKAPDDWRFTDNPVAKFMIYDEKTGAKLVGGSWRECRQDVLDRVTQKLAGLLRRRPSSVAEEMAREAGVSVKRRHQA